jgi:hypothetical protein
MVSSTKGFIAKIIDSMMGKPDDHLILEFQSRGIEIYDLSER